MSVHVVSFTDGSNTVSLVFGKVSNRSSEMPSVLYSDEKVPFAVDIRQEKNNRNVVGSSIYQQQAGTTLLPMFTNVKRLTVGMPSDNRR